MFVRVNAIERLVYTTDCLDNDSTTVLLGGALAMKRGAVAVRVSSSRVAEQLKPLPEAASLLLDVARFCLSVTVLTGHLAQPAFSQGWPSLILFANAAVPGFFIISGFVMRYITKTRERQLTQYIGNRIARLYSVIIPALLLTLLSDWITVSFAPEFYHNVVHAASLSSLPMRALINLLCLTQVWGHTVLFLSNLPLWSLGYEVPYYLVFGLVTFTRGLPRLLGLGLCVIVFGPQITFLLALWWSGVWLYDLWQWFRASVRSRKAKATTLFLCAGITVLLLTSTRDAGLYRRIASLPNPLLMLNQSVGRATMTTYAQGSVAFCVLFLLLCLSDLLEVPSDTRWSRLVRFIAEGTFSLYLFHYPLLVLAAGLKLYRPDSTPEKIVVIIVLTTVCIVAAVPINLFKARLRTSLATALGSSVTRW